MTETQRAAQGAATLEHSSSDKPKVVHKGLTIERIYTTPGVHPYDEVTWERRDVVQTNWKTGDDRLRAARRRVPRLLVGQRLHDRHDEVLPRCGRHRRRVSGRLKQLIDRVVLTYAKAGKDYGYFATDDDAEIFEHELTWALLHQVFSFNSPVWFNVGTTAPQQVSACFILAVDDTMDSILNWYREEGLIFKGGSGAGLNLSRIRSSKELLSSGGDGVRPGQLHARRRRVRRHHQVRRRHPARGEDGRARRRPPRHRGVRRDQGREEDKIRVLRDAGFDMDLGGKDITSVQYQNANNSVRVSDEFMRAVEDGHRLRSARPHDRRGHRDRRRPHPVGARSPRPRGSAPTRASSTTTRSTTGTPTPRPAASPRSNPCSEYMSLDNSSCNLASLNLLKFLKDDDTFDGATFAKVVELVITAMDISICFADFPTEAIGDTTRKYRQLGIGYANLGALLMATGLAYDSDGGRALAGAITSLMTGTAYKRSAELAGVVGPYEGFARNAEAHARVMRKHAAANDAMRMRDDARQGRAPARDQGVGRRQQARGEATAGATRRPRCSRPPAPSAS